MRLENAVVVFSLTSVLWSGCGGAPQSTPSGSPTSAESPAPRFDLASVTGYDLRVIAVTGKPIGDEKAVVQEITDWSLNRKGQIAVRAEKKSPNRFGAADLFRIDAGQPVFLLSQRGEGEHSERRVPSFAGCLLTDRGQVFVMQPAERDEAKTPELWLADEQQVVSIANTPHIESIPDTRRWSEYFRGGGHGRVACFTFERFGSSPPQIVSVHGQEAAPVLSAASDPSQPTRQFEQFGRIWSINANGQIAFDASIGRDPFNGHRLFVYSPQDSASTSGDALGTVKEIARHGGRLMGTKLNLANNNGHDVWKDVQLSDRGDVAMLVEVDTSYQQEKAEGLFVLRPGSEAWETIAQPGQSFGQPAHAIRSVSPATFNSQGQLACAVQIDAEEQYERESRLLRIEPDGKREILFSEGDSASSGEKLLGAAQPRILAGGEIFFRSAVDSTSEPGRYDGVIAITDGKQLLIAIHSSTWEAALPDFNDPRHEEFQVSDSGHIGILLKQGIDKDALLLVSPRTAGTSQAVKK
jgi:hypothetical protein